LGMWVKAAEGAHMWIWAHDRHGDPPGAQT